MKKNGLTLIEVVIVLAVIFILAAILLPSHAVYPHSRQIQCLSNQKQIAIGFIMWNEDNGGKFPWQISGANSEAAELAKSDQPSTHFRALSGYMVNLGVYICSTDMGRQSATNYATLENKNTSYFINVGATTNDAATKVLTGDRYLEVKTKPIGPGLFTYSTNTVLTWTSGFHHNGRGVSWGGISFVDGHVQFLDSVGLNSLLQKQPLVTNRFAIP